jgi:hypothetical protein
MSEETKVRKKPEYTLCEVSVSETGGDVFTPVATANTDLELIEQAKKCGNNNYAIVHTRRLFSVKTVQETVVE